MGKAEILHNLGEGRYRCRILYNRKALEDRKALLESAREKAAAEKQEAESTVATCRAELDGGLLRLNAAIEALRAEASEANRKAVSSLQAEVLRLRATLNRAELRLAGARLVLGSMDAELERLREILKGLDQDVRELWCADHSLALSDTADTLEINGEPGKILLTPGTRHTPPGILPGMLTPISAMTAAQTALNWAFFPGWQKWKPTFRTATLLSRNLQADTGCVTLDADTSSVRGLPIHTETSLTDIPIEYMACNAKAFEEGDRVVIEFRGQKQESPVIIGFENHPRPCPTHILLRVVFHRCALYWDVVNDDFADIPWQAPEGWKAGDPWPEGWPDGWNYGPPSKWQMGDPWPYTRHLKRVLQFDDDGRRLHYEMEQGHKHFIRQGVVSTRISQTDWVVRGHPRKDFSQVYEGANPYSPEYLAYIRAGQRATWPIPGPGSFLCSELIYQKSNLDGDLWEDSTWDLTEAEHIGPFEPTPLHPHPIVLRDARYNHTGTATYHMVDPYGEPQEGCAPAPGGSDPSTGIHMYIVQEFRLSELRESHHEAYAKLTWPGGETRFGLYWKQRRMLEHIHVRGEFGIDAPHPHNYYCRANSIENMKMKTLNPLKASSGKIPVSYGFAYHMDTALLPNTAVVLEHLRLVGELEEQDEANGADPFRALGTYPRNVEWGPVTLGLKTAYTRARRSTTGAGMGKVRECAAEALPQDESLTTGYTVSPWLNRQLQEMLNRQPPHRVFLAVGGPGGKQTFFHAEYYSDGTFKQWVTGPEFAPGEGFFRPAMLPPPERRQRGLNFLPMELRDSLKFFVTMKDIS
ncbi:hypothetical protein [Desulfobotulus sp.]|uniref:hypothetical protein n=1 Tax=Desulfobotulus sp. TaxID=1940337 RepID=UPI002A37136E|nr:hypothetical protein [Desulfobotulus sp.]MDY0164580.1 hypothetical protein [Desulfobotulus sp.]